MFLHVLKNNIKYGFRDPLFVFLMLMTVPFLFFNRWIFRVLTSFLHNKFEFDLSPYYDLICSFMPIGAALFVGGAYSFVLLDQKDDDTLSAIRITPIGLRGYLLRILTLPILYTVIFSFISLPILDLSHLPPFYWMLFSTCSVVFTIIYLAMLTCYSKNKVQGLALSKVSGIFIWLPAISYFVDEPWQWLFGIIPTYWITKFAWLAFSNSNAALWIWLLGTGVQLGMLYLLWKHYIKKVL